MLAIFLTICAAYLVIMGGVVLVWLRIRRVVPYGKHHRGDPLRAAGTVAPGAGGPR